MVKHLILPAPFKQKFSVSIRVTVDGIFTCYLPENIKDLFKNSGVKLNSGRGRNCGVKYGFYAGETLMEMMGKIAVDIETACSQKEVSRVKVIRYRISTRCSYVIDKDSGAILPNGACWTESYGKWEEGTDTARDPFGRHQPFSFGAYARPLTKITYAYHDGTQRVEYQNIYIDKYLQSNHFSTLKEQTTEPENWVNDLQMGREPEGCQEMPYSEKAIVFFRDLIVYICVLNERMKDFQEPEKLMKLIQESSQGLLGIPERKEKKRNDYEDET